MNWLRQKLRAFMLGRYGTDDLYYFLFILYTVLLLINCFVHSPGMSIALWIILFYALFRITSRNIGARQKENAKYLIIKNKVTKSFRQFKQRFNDKEHAYKRCPHCRAMLRFPRKKGSHHAVCPKCHKELKVTIFFDKV